MAKRYTQVAQKLAADIAADTYPVGTTLPSEPVLADSLGVSRSTLRAALEELQKLGLVSRRPSLGTRVEAKHTRMNEGSFSQTLGSIDAIVQYARSTLREGLSYEDVTVDTGLATQLATEGGTRWLKISYRRVDMEKPTAPPICWTDVYVGERYADVIKSKVTVHPGAISELVEEAAGRPIVRVEQTLRASGIPNAIAAALQTAENEHALVITRRYYMRVGELALVSVSLHPGDRFSYVSTLSRG